MLSRLNRLLLIIRTRSGAELLLAVAAIPVTAMAMLLRRAVGLKRAALILDQIFDHGIDNPRVVDPNAIAAAVDLVAMRLPAASCIERSLTNRTLMRRRGHAAQIILGVPSSAPLAGDFRAHAWIQIGAEPVGEASNVQESFVVLGTAIDTKDIR